MWSRELKNKNFSSVNNSGYLLAGSAGSAGGCSLLGVVAAGLSCRPVGITKSSSVSGGASLTTVPRPFKWSTCLFHISPCSVCLYLIH